MCLDLIKSIVEKLGSHTQDVPNIPKSFSITTVNFKLKLKLKVWFLSLLATIQVLSSLLWLVANILNSKVLDKDLISACLGV